MDEQRKEEFHNFIDETLNDYKGYKKFVISDEIPQRFANAIKEILNIDVSDYKNEITETIIRHIYQKHGEFGVSDHSMKDMHKLDRITEFMEGYDEIALGKDDYAYKNSDNTPGKNVELIKKYPDEIGHLVESINVSAKKAIHPKSMYYSKIEKDTGQVPDVKSPSVTSETMLTNNVSFKKSITKPEDTVNNQIIKDLKKNNFQPTSSLVNNMKKINDLAGHDLSIADVSNMYSGIKNQEIQDIVKSIAEECAQQEKNRKVPTLNE